MSRSIQFRLLIGLTLVWLVWVGWALAWGTSDRELQIVDDHGELLVGAQAYVGEDLVGTSNYRGVVSVPWRRAGIQVRVDAQGYSPRTLRLGWGYPLTQPLRLKPNYLRGSVSNPEGRPVEGVRISSAGAETTTDASGDFVLRRAEPGPIGVWRPAWEDTDFSWDGGPGRWEVEIKPLVVKAVHLNGPSLANPDRRRSLFGVSLSTELNALMIDLKDEEGLVWYDTEVAQAHRYGAVPAGYELDPLVREADEMGLYVIGRIVAFQDPIAAERNPAIAVWDHATAAPFQKRNQWFLDPTDPDAQQYSIQLAREACQRGVDEIQFDYVRFPDGYPSTVVFDGKDGPEDRVRSITGFLQSARELLHPLGCVLAADVFGFVTTATDDGGIGQRWPDIAEVVDVISPMLYPSHYDQGWFGYDEPNQHPGEVVSRALSDGLNRLDSRTVVRPWLQDFGYDPDQVRAGIEAVEAENLGWMLWNAASEITTEALDPASDPTSTR